MARPKKKDKSVKKSTKSQSPSQLLNELKNSKNSSQFERKILDICDALEKETDRNAPETQKVYSSLTEFFDSCLSSNDDRTTLKTITRMADLHFNYGNTKKALMFFKSCIKAEKNSTCKCCLWRYYTYFCDMPKDLNEALDEINGFLHAQNQKKGEYYAIILFFKGRVLYDLEKYEDALGAFRKALKTINKEKDGTDLTNPMILYQIAKCHQSLKDYKTAIQVFDNLLKKDYGGNGNLKGFLAGIAAKLHRALCFQENKEYSKAFTALNDFVNFMETDTRVSVFRMRYQILNDYHFQATQALDLIQDKFSPHKTELRPLTSKQDMAKNQEAEIKLREAKDFMLEEEYEKAYHLFKEVVTIRKKLYKGNLPDSNILNIYPDLLRCCLKFDKPLALEAIDYGKQSICAYSSKEIAKLASKSMDIERIHKVIDYYFYELACAYMSVRYFSEARKYFQKSFLCDKSRKTTDREVIALRIHKVGRMSLCLGMYEKAIIYFEKAARILKSHKEPNEQRSMEIWTLNAHNVLSLAQSYKAVDMYEKALEVIQKSEHLPLKDDIKADIQVVASICLRRLGRVSEGWETILKAEEIEHSVGKQCPHSVASPIFLHKFVCSIEKFKSGMECEEQLNTIMYPDDQENQVLKLRSAFIRSFDHGDVRALLEYLLAYLKYVRIQGQVFNLGFIEPVMKPMRDNFSRFFNSNLITNFFKVKQVERGTKDKFLLHIPLDECLEDLDEKRKFFEERSDEEWVTTDEDE